MRMVFLLATAAAIAAMGVADLGATQSGADSSQVCGAADGGVKFLCGPGRPEDLFHIPRTNWIVSSSMDGGLHLIDARKKTSLQFYPSPAARDRLDKTNYPTCEGPPGAAEKEAFTTLGLSVRLGSAGVHTVYAIRYPTVSRVHVFELDVNVERPAVTWIGCVEAPDRILLNSIVPLSDGGFLASHFYERGPSGAASRERALAGEPTGELLRWHSRTGWSKVAGSEGAGMNGVEVSPDGEWIYAAEWGAQTFFRMPLRGGARRDSIKLDFRPDNVHWAPDGTLLLAGHTDSGSNVVKVDPATLRVTELIRRPDDQVFWHASAAVQVDDELWLATSRAPRIAIYPLTPKK
jgi:hypothetical protein